MANIEKGKLVFSSSATSNASYPDTSGYDIEEVGSPFQFSASGTWDGATVTVEAKPLDHTNWIAVSGSALTADGTVEITGGAGDFIRATVSGAGGSTDLILTTTTRA